MATTLDTMEVNEPEYLQGLDAIRVFFLNYEPGKGEIVITCYDSAWKAYFGGMYGDTIQKFVNQAGADYLLPKLGITQWLKKSATHDKYLTRVIKAVKAKLRFVVLGKSLRLATDDEIRGLGSVGTDGQREYLDVLRTHHLAVAQVPLNALDGYDHVHLTCYDGTNIIGWLGRRSDGRHYPIGEYMVVVDL